MQPTVAAKGYEKNAWVLVTIVGAIGIIFSFLMIAGVSDAALPAYSAYTAYIARIGGFSLLGFAIVGIAISLTAYKKGEKWAWYVVWYLPTYFIIETADGYLQGSSTWPIEIILLLISLAALLLPYRIFFPK